MAKSNNVKTAAPVSAQGGWRGINEFVQPEGKWHAHIEKVKILPSEDGFKAPKVCLVLVGPGTLGAHMVEVKLPYELGLIALPNGELGLTELTQLYVTLGVLDIETLDSEEAQAAFSIFAVTGLAVRCETVKQEVVKTVGTTNLVTRYTSVVVPSIELDV